MALDPRFICTSDLEGLFVDKNTGLPMAAGKIYFYSDFARQIPKAVYQLTGSPPSGFVALPNPLTLNSIGSYQDNLGNEIVIYYLPFEQTVDGDISTTTDVQELYYISVFNSDGVLQFTRDAWPPLASNLTPGDTTDNGVRNYIPNGQFLSHNDHPITDTTSQPGLDIVEVAQGGWSFKKTTGGTGTYTITFNNESNASLGALKDFPPFSINIVTAGSGTETIRDLVIQWPDVSRFSLSTPLDYNFLFAATSNNPSTINVDMRLILNYGTGGSAQEDTSLGLKSIGPASNGFQYFNRTITVPSTAGKTITADSFIAIALRLPSSTPIDIRLTDFAFTLGAGALAQFPVTTNAQMLSQGVAGWMPTPNPDGSDLYLSLILTDKGMIFDHSIVGQVVGKTETAANAVNNELLMDGSTYVYSAYSSLGIPYKRLADYLILNSPAMTIGTSTIPAQSIPLFGTGPNFVTILKNTDPTKFDLNFNTTSGGNSTNNQTSGFTHTSADPLYVYTVTGVPTAGTYFSFTPATGGALVYNVWFTVDGAGTAPTTPSGANIPVAIVSGDTVAITITKILNAVNKYQFMILNARGYFWRGLDTGTSVDPDSAARLIQGITDNSVAVMGANLGSVEGAAFLQHTHNATTQFFESGPGANTYDGAAFTFNTQATTGNSSLGGNETRPINLALNWFIKY